MNTRKMADASISHFHEVPRIAALVQVVQDADVALRLDLDLVGAGVERERGVGEVARTLERDAALAARRLVIAHLAAQRVRAAQVLGHGEPIDRGSAHRRGGQRAGLLHVVRVTARVQFGWLSVSRVTEKNSTTSRQSMLE